jgi:integrase
MKVLERVRFGARGQGSLVRFEGVAPWYSCLCVRGKEHRESTGTPDLKMARRRHRQRLDEIAADRQGLKKFLSPVAQRTPIGALLDDLEADYRLRTVKSWAQVQSHLRPIRAHFGTWRAVDLTAEAVDAYIEARLDADKAAATINRETQLLGQAMRLALERGRITALPSIRHLPERNVRQGFFERPDLEAVVAALPDYLQDFTWFGSFTGWRRGEIISLRWADVDRDGGAIRLRPEASKNGRGRTVILAGELAGLMERRWRARVVTDGPASRVAELVFHRDGAPIGDFRKAWASACVAAGLFQVIVGDTEGTERRVPSRLFHDLRRTAVRTMIRAGVREGVAMAISGHRTRSIFDRYNITSEADLREAMRQTSQYVETLPTTRPVSDLRSAAR